MSGDTTSILTDLIERLRLGDDLARRELLDRSYERLTRITATIYRQDYRRLRGRHDLESVVNQVWIRLRNALETTRPQTVDGFFRLVSLKARQVLLDAAGRQDRDDAGQTEAIRGEYNQVGLMPIDPSDSTFDPVRLALLTEVHQKISELPPDELAVFGLVYYCGFTQAKAAESLNLEPRQVSRLWWAATGRLARWMDGINELI
jgi:RNA polymerase sigma factor (sigma-70 family)